VLRIEEQNVDNAIVGPRAASDGTSGVDGRPNILFIMADQPAQVAPLRAMLARRFTEGRWMR